MILTEPIWFVLLIPLAWAWWRWPAPSRVLQAIRALLLLLIIFAMAGPAFRFMQRSGTVVVVADRSRSMPANAASHETEAINLIQQAGDGDDRLAIVSFGRRALIESARQDSEFSGFTENVNQDGSNLGAAIDRALSLIPKGGSGRILILSDGRWTGVDPAGPAARAANRSIPIDYRRLTRPRADDLAISRFVAPDHVGEHESFMLHAWVQSPVSQTVHYQLRRGDTIIASGDRDVAAGQSHITFQDTAGTPGVDRYTLTVRGEHKDPVPENNRAKVLLTVDGPKPILCLSDSPGHSLAKLLSAGGLGVSVADPGKFDYSLESLSRYAAVILENVPAGDMSENQMSNLAHWVQDAGRGLVMTGGQQSFGPGGYFKSPIAPILPVSMELRQEDRKLSMAIVVALDRSGSMAMPTTGGRTKMSLADLGTAQVLKLLSPMDQFGVLAVDTTAHTIVPFGSVPVDQGPSRDKILRIRSMGGGIFIYQALLAASHTIAGASAGSKHIVLFADASDSEEPGDYKTLLKECTKANITVSVIGLGLPTDSDADLLRDIAKHGHGKVYFTNNPNRLPQLFAQDTFLVARSAFISDPTPVHLTAGLTSLTNENLPDPPPVGGYNLCYLRKDANLVAVTKDQYKAPLIASWHAGIGRVAAYTGEADGQYTGAIARWPHVGQMFTSLARWAAGKQNPLGEHMMLTQRVERGAVTIQLHLDPDHPADAVTNLPTVITLQGQPGRSPSVRKSLMHWTSPDTLTAQIPLVGSETTLNTVKVPDFALASMPPVCLPYSPEFAPATVDHRGQKTLVHLARETNGQERTELANIWQTMPPHLQQQSIAMWLIMAAVVLLLFEVLERRAGIIGIIARGVPRRVRLLRRASRTIEADLDAGGDPVHSSPASRHQEPAIATPASRAKEQNNLAPKTRQAAGVLDAMKQVQQKRQRQERGKSD